MGLLKSMGDEMLRESLEELGMDLGSVDRLAGALFGEEEDGGLALEGNESDALSDGLELEGNDSDDGLALEENDTAPAPPPRPPPRPVAPPPSQVATGVSDASKRAAERIKAQGNDALKAGLFAEAAELYGQVRAAPRLGPRRRRLSHAAPAAPRGARPRACRAPCRAAAPRRARAPTAPRSSSSRQAIAIDPGNAVFYSNRSSAYASLLNFERALTDAKK